MTEVRLSIAIMAVPERSADVERLQRRLGVTVPVAWDSDHRGAWWNAQRAWGNIKGGATHHLVLQDDVGLCKDFIPSVEKAVGAVPGNPIGLYANRNTVEEARQQNSSWIICRYGMWGAALLLPVGVLAQFLRWTGRYINPEYPHDDRALGLFAKHAGLDCYATVPSLVEHVGHGRSVFGHNPPVPQVARWYIGDENSGLDVDWTKGLDNPPVCVTGAPDAAKAFAGMVPGYE